MTKRKIIAASALPMRFPWGATVLAWLLTDKVRPLGPTVFGAWVVLAGAFVLVAWVAAIAQIWMCQAIDPFNEQGGAR